MTKESKHGIISYTVKEELKMLTLLLTILFIWLVFKAVENVAEELGRYIRGFFKWLWKMYKKHINKGVSL